MLLEAAGAGAIGVESVFVTCAAGTTGDPEGVASAVADFDFLLFFVFVVVVAAIASLAAGFSPAAGFAALSSAVVAAFLLFRDFLVAVAVVSVADLSVEAVVWSAAAFLAFFLDFLVVVLVVLWASVELACAFAKAGEITTVSIRQKQHIQRITLRWERFIFPRRR
jgi:hypothetical protein